MSLIKHSGIVKGRYIDDFYSDLETWIFGNRLKLEQMDSELNRSSISK